MKNYAVGEEQGKCDLKSLPPKLTPETHKRDKEQKTQILESAGKAIQLYFADSGRKDREQMGNFSKETNSKIVKGKFCN